MTEPTPPTLERLKVRAQFLAAAQAPSCARGSVVIQRLPQPEKAAIGVGFTATKKIGGAVERNRAKRRMREAARQLLPLHGEPRHDYVFVARGGVIQRPWARLLDDVKTALISLAAGRADPPRQSRPPSSKRRSKPGPALTPPRPVNTRPMDQNNTRNTIVFVICAAVLMLLYQVFVMEPISKRREAEAQAHAAAVAAAPLAMADAGSSVFVSREQAVAQSPRVKIDTPALQGSLALKGGRLDDLFLKEYRETLAKNSPPVELFRPEGAKNAYFSDSGWTGPIQTPGPTTLWTAPAGATLTPSTPVDP